VKQTSRRLKCWLISGGSSQLLSDRNSSNIMHYCPLGCDMI
jgi:hypothetical protein